jgi:mannose-6-phosphate isomerase-like protein (cupin superfamily)
MTTIKSSLKHKGKLIFRLFAIAAAYLFAGTLLDSVIFPEGDAGPAFYPPSGYQFASKKEGFRQTVLQRQNGLVWTELVLDPHAAGPPEHVHTSFAEGFVVTEGTLTILFQGQKRLVHAGESLVVPPGTPHKPFNETDSRVVVRAPLTPEDAMPERFVVFLTQAYAFFDESPSNNSPLSALLQMSRFSPTYDAWLGDVPITAQKALFYTIRPAARLLGYRTFYDRYIPRTRPETARKQ